MNTLMYVNILKCEWIISIRQLNRGNGVYSYFSTSGGIGFYIVAEGYNYIGV